MVPGQYRSVWLTPWCVWSFRAEMRQGAPQYVLVALVAIRTTHVTAAHHELTAIVHVLISKVKFNQDHKVNTQIKKIWQVETIQRPQPWLPEISSRGCECFDAPVRFMSIDCFNRCRWSLVAHLTSPTHHPQLVLQVVVVEEQLLSTHSGTTQSPPPTPTPTPKSTNKQTLINQYPQTRQPKITTNIVPKKPFLK